MAIGCTKCGGTSFFRLDKVTSVVRCHVNGTLYENINELKSEGPFSNSIIESKTEFGDAWRCKECKEIIVEMRKTEEEAPDFPE